MPASMKRAIDLQADRCEDCVRSGRQSAIQYMSRWDHECLTTQRRRILPSAAAVAALPNAACPDMCTGARPPVLRHHHAAPATIKQPGPRRYFKTQREEYYLALVKANYRPGFRIFYELELKTTTRGSTNVFLSARKEECLKLEERPVCGIQKSLHVSSCVHRRQMIPHILCCV